MSKTQLQSNNTRLASLIDELRGKAAGGDSSGDESVETCTVTVRGYTSDYRAETITYTLVGSDGKITSQKQTNSSSATVTLNNVVCGSAVNVQWRSGYNMSGNFTVTNAEILSYITKDNTSFKITAPTGGAADIYNYNTDGYLEPPL